MMPMGRTEGPKRRSGPKSKTSCYLGVTQYKRTGRWEAHIWDSGDPEYKKGRQLHLGSFPAAVPAALAYDRAAHIIRPRNSSRNFPGTDYSKDEFILRYGHLSKAEFVTQLRNWAQDPHLAVEYSSAAYRAERQLLRPPVLLPPVAAPPPRQVPQPFASPVRQRPQEMPPSRAQELLARRAHPLEAPPPLSPVPRPALKRPRSQIKTRPRSNIKPVHKEAVAVQRQAFADDDSDLEEDCEGKPVPCPSMVMLLMAMKASDAAAAAAAPHRMAAPNAPQALSWR